MKPDAPRERRRAERYALQILRRLETALEMPLVILGFVWLILFVLEMLDSLGRFGLMLGQIIYGVFLLDFALRFVLAPDKLGYLKRNWFTGLTLLLPAMRVFRAGRALRLLGRTRSLSLVRLLGSLNRGMAALGRSMRRRGLGYVSLFTLIVLLVGAAGMLHYERGAPGGIQDYGAALWWTTMLMTTLGSEYWPQTAEGRFLCVLLSVYTLAVFTYLTGAIATFFVGRDAEDDGAEVAGTRQVRQLELKIDRLQAAVEALSERLRENEAPGNERS